MIKRTNCLERAGHILILINWLQGRIVDFIIFKKHSRALTHYRKHNSSPTLGKERKRYWQMSFGAIRKEFGTFFPNIDKSWHNLLKHNNNIRDMIAHGHISLYREYVLYYPDENRNDIQSKLKVIRQAVIGKVTKKRIFRLRFDDKNYSSMISDVTKFDESLFPELAKQLNFIYETIR